MSEGGTHHGNPETLFVETIQTLVNKLESEINIWCSDDEI